MKFTIKSLLIGKVEDLIIPFRIIKVRWLSLVSVMYFSPRLLLPHSLPKSEEKATFSVRGESKSGAGKTVGEGTVTGHQCVESQFSFIPC